MNFFNLSQSSNENRNIDIDITKINNTNNNENNNTENDENNTENEFIFDDHITILGNIIKESNTDINKLIRSNKIKDIYSSIPWFTYKIGFNKILDTDIISDIGWGCMIRSGQMVLANAMIKHYLGNNWIINNNKINRDINFEELKEFSGCELINNK